MFLGLVFGLLPIQHVNKNWVAVEDTYIDTELSDFNFGRDAFLLGGKGMAMLVRFPELNWIAPNKKAVNVKITFTMTEPADIKLKSASVLTTAWIEGSGLRLPVPRAIQPDAQYRMGASWNNRAYGVSGETWDKPGAQGDNDSNQIPNAKVSVNGNQVEVSGIDAATLEMSTGRSQNLGFRFEFENKVAFYSSEGYGPGPQISYTLEDANSTAPNLAVTALVPSDEGWTAKVKNLGKDVVTGLNATWYLRGEKKSTSSTQKALAPGDTAVVTWQRTNNDKSSPDVTAVGIQVNAGGPMSFREEPATGLPVTFELSPESKSSLRSFIIDELEELALSRLVTFINYRVLAQSRTAFSTSGCRERIRLDQDDDKAFKVKLDLTKTSPENWLNEGAKQTLRSLSPYSGAWMAPPDTTPRDSESIGWLPDTRDDSAWPTSLMLPNFPWGGPKQLQNPLPERNLLSRAEVTALNEMASHRILGTIAPDANKLDFKPALPAALILSLTDMGGYPISEANVDVYQTNDGKLGTSAVFSGTTTSSGKVYIPGKPGSSAFGELKSDGSNSWMLVRVTRDFMTETTWLSATDLASEFARGNVSVPTVELKLPLASGPINEADDLASGKFVTDSNGGTPAQLAGLVDADSNTSIVLDATNKAHWVEIDLGRDRLIGAIDIEYTDKPLAKFDITVRPTGQKESDATSWFAENSGSRRAKEFGKQEAGHTVIRYVSSATRSRYVKFIYSQAVPIEISNIRIRTIKQN